MRKLRESLGTFAVVLRNRDVRRLEAAWAASNVASWAYSVAIVVYTYDAGGAGLVGIAIAIKILPAAIAAPLLATLADRRSRGGVLIGAGLAQGFVTGLIALLIFAEAPVALVIALATVFTILTTALQPAVSSLLPQLCERPEELTAANVVNSAVESLSIFVGPAIGAFVIGFGGPEVLAAATTVGFVASALLAAAVREPQRGAGTAVEATAEDADESGASEAEAGMLADVAEGFSIVRSDRILRTIVGLMVAQTFVDGALGVLIPVAAFELLGSGDAGIGLLNAAVGVGALLGTAAAAGIVGRPLGPPFAIGMALWGAPLAAIAVLPYEAAALVLFGVIGLGNILIDVSGFTMLQRAAPEEATARVLGVLEAAMLTSVALGALVTPLLLTTMGTEATFLACGLFLPAMALIFWSRLRSIDAASATPTQALELLRPLALFSPLGPLAIEGLARKSSRVRVAAGEDVFHQGDAGDRFFVIAEGQVRVLVDGAEARVEGPGEHFGEIALLRDVARTATVQAIDDVELLCLEGADFVAAVSGDADALGAADSVVAARLEHMRPALGTF
ncbi:MAG: MFS transporter [Solirubrobacterales bacterium]|nr:MFS transporter [Solirubrobacterales bacterium]MCB8971766.1 MFS transporter [Thermoleophilales bacterium]MCO5327987.1 MFS transporter [Solirubrobacterales bacterium]